MSKTKLPFSAGKAGAGTVDLYSGAVEISVPLINIAGDFNWNVSIIYYSDTEGRAKQYPQGQLFFTDWKMSLSQRLTKSSKDYGRFYTDAMNYSHRLCEYKQEDGSIYYADAEGLGLNFAAQGNNAVMADTAGNIYTFNDTILSKIERGDKKIYVNMAEDETGTWYDSFIDSNGNGIKFWETDSDKTDIFNRPTKDYYRFEIWRNNKKEKALYASVKNGKLTGLYTDSERTIPEITFEYDEGKPCKIVCGGEELSISYTDGKATHIKTKTGALQFNTSINYLSQKTVVTDPMGVTAAYIMNDNGETVCRYEEINGEPAGIVEYAKTLNNTTVTASVPASPSGDNLIYCLSSGGSGNANIVGIDNDRIYTLCGWVENGDSDSGLKATVNGVQYSRNFDSNASGKQFTATAFKSGGAQSVKIETFGAGTFTNVCLYKGGSSKISETLTRMNENAAEDEFNFSDVTKLFSGEEEYTSGIAFSKENYINMSLMLQKKARYTCIGDADSMTLIATNTDTGAVLCYDNGRSDSVNITDTKIKTKIISDYADSCIYTKFIPGESSPVIEQTVTYNGQEYKSYSDGTTQTDLRGVKCELQKTETKIESKTETTQTQNYTSSDKLSMQLKTITASGDTGTTVKSYDARGYYSETKYDASGKPVYFMNPIVASGSVGEKINYTGDSFYANVQGKNCDFVSDIFSNETQYALTDDRVTSLKHNNMYFSLKYDVSGNITKVSAGGATLLDKSYNIDLANSSSTETSQFNGVESVLRHDKYGRLTSVAENGTPVQTNSYQQSASGNLEKYTDHITNSEHLFSYDGDGDIKTLTVKDKLNGAVKNRVTFAKTKEKVTGAQFDIGGGKTNYSYGYDNYPDSKITKTAVSGKFITETSYDGFGRITDKTLTNAKNNNTIYKEVYSYIANGSDTTPYVEKIDFNDGASYLSYDYDMNGNITDIYGAEHKSYAYDTLNRLEAEVSGMGSTAYAYDDGGNRTAEKRGENIALYTYDGTWKDKLIGFNGQSITYDSVGNPLSYLGANLTWTRGRILEDFTKNELSVNYSYDASGLRTNKTVLKNGAKTEHNYTYIGGQLMREHIRKAKIETLYSSSSYCSDTSYCGLLAASQGGIPTTAETAEIDDLTYHYDQTGIAGFTHRKHLIDTNYYYRKNLQGDIIEIYDENGLRVAAYSYDAWGNCSITCNISGIAELNPIRYRGYYYDSETKLYYLQSRYYDPIIGRFINADDIRYALEQSGQLNGLNLFAYCLNNPVMLSDNTGHSWESFWSNVWNGIKIGGATIASVAAVAAGSKLIGMGLVALGAPLLGFGIGSLSGGIISSYTGGNFLEGWVAGGVLGGAIGLTIGGFAVGVGTYGGLLMASYGISVASNMLEVGILQFRKSRMEGRNGIDSFGNVMRAMYANSGTILAGNAGIGSLSIIGSRFISKAPTLFSLIKYMRLGKTASLSVGAGLIAYLTAKASPLSIAIAGIFAAYNVGRMFSAFFADPYGSKYILF